MKARISVPITILIVLSAFMGIVCIISFARAIRLINHSFPGFLVYHGAYVGSISVRDWPGRQAGLEYLERIAAVDGQPVQRGRDVMEAARQRTPGTPVKYVVESNGKRREVTIPVANFGLRDFFLAFFCTTTGGLILCVLGVIVVLLKPNIAPSWVFLALCFSLGGYMMTSFEILSTYSTVPFHYLALCLFPATFFHLGLIFPDRKRFLDRRPKLQYLIYLPAVIMAVLYEIYYFTSSEFSSGKPLSWLPTYHQLGAMARLFTLFGVLGLIFFVVLSLFKAPTLTARVRSRMILFGVTVAFLPSALAMMALHFLDIIIPWNFLVFFVIFFPASIAYSIVRHNLFEADAIIRRTIGYVVVTAVIVGAYALVSVGLNVFLESYQLSQSRAFPILFTLGVILVFNPLRDRIQALVDRLFFRKEYDYGAIIEKVGGAMTSLLDLPQILKRLTQTFMEDMFISTSSVMLLSTSGTEFQVILADGERKKELENRTFQRDNPLMKIIEGNRKELTKYDVLEDPRYSAYSEKSKGSFDELCASLIVPLVYQNQVIGSMNLGEKKSGKFYNREDIDLLRAIANQGAVAIENAKMVEEIVEKERIKTKIMDSFGKYVTSEVRDQILEGRIPLDGELKDVTVLFADLRGFTTLTESTNPKEVVKIINDYFSEMAEAIGQNHGLVLQFIGDEIEAVFGAPTPLDDHPTHAVRAAMAMRERLVKVNEKLQQKGYTPLRHGIGIHSGNVVAANIGSEDRLSYALVGDTVNAASRIQSLNKEFDSDILISAVTLERLSEFIHGEKLGATPVKGKKDAVEIFKLA